MKELEYPFDCELILSRRRSLKKELLKEISEAGKKTLKKKIAVLGGSTTSDIRNCLRG